MGIQRVAERRGGIWQSLWTAPPSRGAHTYTEIIYTQVCKRTHTHARMVQRHCCSFPNQDDNVSTHTRTRYQSIRTAISARLACDMCVCVCCLLCVLCALTPNRLSRHSRTHTHTYTPRTHGPDRGWRLSITSPHSLLLRIHSAVPIAKRLVG